MSFFCPQCLLPFPSQRKMVFSTPTDVVSLPCRRLTTTGTAILPLPQALPTYLAIGKEFRAPAHAPSFCPPYGVFRLEASPLPSNCTSLSSLSLFIYSPLPLFMFLSISLFMPASIFCYRSVSLPLRRPLPLPLNSESTALSALASCDEGRYLSGFPDYMSDFDPSRFNCFSNGVLIWTGMVKRIVELQRSAF